MYWLILFIALPLAFMIGMAVELDCKKQLSYFAMIYVQNRRCSY